MGVPECEGRAGPYASRRTLSRGSEVVRSLEDFGRLQIHAGRELQKGDDPRTDHRRGLTHNSRAGIPKRLRPNCHQSSTLKPAWTATVRKGTGAQRPHCAKGRDREPRRRGAICCYGLSRQPQARSGQTVGEDRPTSLPSSSTVFTVGAGLHWTTSKTDAVLRQVDDIHCCSTTGAWS